MNLVGLLPRLKAELRFWSTEARLLRWLTLFWLLVGLGTMYSASYPVAAQDFGDGLYYFKRQLIWVLVGVVIFEGMTRLPLKRLLQVSTLIYLVLLSLLVVTLFLGKDVNGSTRWLSILGVPLQPSEFIKPFLVIQGAQLFSQWKFLPWENRGAWLGIFGLTLGLILIQPNLSTTALCGTTLWLVALASGLSYRYLLTSAAAGVVLATLSVSINQYQRTRLTTFLNPWRDARGDGYQLVQSLLAVGSGGLHGVGFGMSQQKLEYLPYQDTDFIFAVFAEEFGFFGGVLLLTLLITYASIGVMVAWRSRHPVYQLIIIGCTVLLVGQAMLNVGVAIGALPTTGLPFPLLSYGGSSMMTSLFIAGLLVRAARESDEAHVVELQR